MFNLSTNEAAAATTDRSHPRPHLAPAGNGQAAGPVGGGGSPSSACPACSRAAPDVDAYWRNILGKVDSDHRSAAGGVGHRPYYDPELRPTPTRSTCKRGGYLGALVTFDPLEYGIPPVSVGRRARPVARPQARLRRPRGRRLHDPAREAVRRRTG